MAWHFLVVTAGLLFGQRAEDRQEPTRLALASPEPRVEELMTLRTERIDQALRSPELLWGIRDPAGVALSERRAAARHQWGLKSNPLLTVEEGAAVLGRPESISQRREGSLTVSTSAYRTAERRITAEFVEGVLIRFSVTSP